LEWLEAAKDHLAKVAPVYMVKARYENGIPATSVQGQYQLFRTPSKLSHQEGSICYDFSRLHTLCRQDCKGRILVKQGKIEFDAEGDAKLLLTAENDQFLLDGFEYDLLITAQLPGRETTSLSQSFTVHQGGFDLGLGLKHALIQANEAIDASVISLNFEGDLIADKKVKISLIKEGQKKVLFQETLTTGTEPSTLSIPVDARMEDGIYLLKAESQDEKRNKITVESLVYISTNPQTALSEELHLAVDQPKYFVGGRAHLLISDPDASEDEPVPVIVTYERGGLLGYEAIELTSPVTRIAVPIKEAMMPHFLVRVTRFHRGLNPSFSTSSQQIDVGNDESKIFISLDYESEVLQPGKEVTLKIRTHDYQNRPLSSVVTMNVLDGSESKSEFSYEKFFTSEVDPLTSASNISLNNGALYPEYQDTVSVASIDFSNSKYFNPLIETNAQGEAEVSFDLPASRKDLSIQI
jgi:hypothetical protein